MKTTESQEKRILEYLQSGLSITQYQALTKFDCFRLSARIHRLKSKGYNIEKRMKKLSNGKRIAVYYFCRKILPDGKRIAVPYLEKD